MPCAFGFAPRSSRSFTISR